MMWGNWCLRNKAKHDVTSVFPSSVGIGMKHPILGMSYGFLVQRSAHPPHDRHPVQRTPSESEGREGAMGRRIPLQRSAYDDLLALLADWFSNVKPQRYFFPGLYKIIAQTHCYTSWTNSKTKEKENKLFMQRQICWNDGATHSIAFIFFDSPSMDQNLFLKMSGNDSAASYHINHNPCLLSSSLDIISLFVHIQIISSCLLKEVFLNYSDASKL